MHAFVAMPYGTKEGIDFNKVYLDYIKPALISAGFDVFRSDEEMRAGDIRTDMFQDLLLADLVVVDLSIDNPNVWYELGVRHALRSRGVIQIQCRRDHLPFDICVDRTLRYHVKDGSPDPEFLEADSDALAKFAKETMASWYGRKISPVYHLLPYLAEPDWKSLHVQEAKEIWEAYERWLQRIDLARRKGRPGDILVFAAEVPSWPLRLEAYRAAGKALLKLKQFEFARMQFEKALEIDPNDLESRGQLGILLGRLQKPDEARVILTKLVQDYPEDAESWGLLGRVEKDAWTGAWRKGGMSGEQMREAALAEEGTLREAVEAYRSGFRKDPRNYYPGINAVTLLHLLGHLTGAQENGDEIQALEGGVRWAAQSALAAQPRDYWARVTLGDLEILSGSKDRVLRQYRLAVSVAEKDWFALDSSRQQLVLLQDLGFRPEVVGPAIEVFNHELQKVETPAARWTPAQVFLFSGHMIDKPDRIPPRFPPEKVPIAARLISKKLEELGAGPADLAICGGACGGDILFAEACLDRGLRLQIHIQFQQAEFLAASVDFAGMEWADRFERIKSHPNSTLLVMPDELGPLPKSGDPYERNNLWQLNTALCCGPHRVRFIALWDGKAGDGGGGTKHMVEVVKQNLGRAYLLGSGQLW